MAARKKLNYLPRRGDLVWLDFDPRAGHEQQFVAQPHRIVDRVPVDERSGQR